LSHFRPFQKRRSFQQLQAHFVLCSNFFAKGKASNLYQRHPI
jgi:hypothetical protein